MSKISRLATLICTILVVMLSSCRSARQAIAMKDCSYKFKSISDVSFMGIGANKESLSSASIVKITAAMAGVASSIPFDFTLNLNVTNPNKTKAAVEGLEYVVTVDDIEFAQGHTTTNFSVEGGETAILPLPLKIDLKTALNGEHKKAIAAMVLNMIGIKKDEASRIKVKVKPTVKINKSTIKSPKFIPITFEYGGK